MMGQNKVQCMECTVQENNQWRLEVLDRLLYLVKNARELDIEKDFE